MKENKILLILWIAAAIMLAVATIYMRCTDQARQVESFIDHSEIKPS
jgi:cell division protein FtsL